MLRENRKILLIFFSLSLHLFPFVLEKRLKSLFIEQVKFQGKKIENCFQFVFLYNVCLCSMEKIQCMFLNIGYKRNL